MKRTIPVLITALLFMVCSCNTEDGKNPVMPGKKTVDEKKTELQQGEMKLEKTFYPTGELKTEGNTLNGKREGKWTSWYKNGMIWSETFFEGGQRNGSTSSWYESGQKRYEGAFKDNKRHGSWKYWGENGEVIKEESF